MPLVRVGEIELSYERSGSGPPLLMIMGMSGTSLHWGEPFLAALRERLRDDRLRPPRRRRQHPAGRAGHDRASWPRTPPGCSTALGDRLRARARHLDGRDGRPGARAGSPRARAHAHARLHLLWWRGQRARLREVDAAARRGDDVGRPRARAAHRLGGQRLARARRRRRCLCGASSRSASARRRGAGDHGADAAITAHDTTARLARARACRRSSSTARVDQMLPVQNGRLIAALIPGLAAGDLRRRRPPVLLGAAPSARPSCVRAHAAVHA